MKNRTRYFLFAVCYVAFQSLLAGQQHGSLHTLFIEPDTTRRDSTNQFFHSIEDTARINLYGQWLKNPAAQMALDLYERAWKIAYPETNTKPLPPVYYIALVKGGNYGDVGFQLVTASGVEDHSTTPFIKLDPSDWTFNTTFLHETGHVILSTLNDGKKIPVKEMASISHTTAALTDRGTAFNEGFAEHLETLAAHLLADPVIESRYHHRQFRFGAQDNLGEYNRPVGDLLTFSQTRTRYYDVCENNFAYAPAYDGRDSSRIYIATRAFASAYLAGKAAPYRSVVLRVLRVESLQHNKPQRCRHGSRQDRAATVIAPVINT